MDVAFGDIRTLVDSQGRGKRLSDLSNYSREAVSVRGYIRAYRIVAGPAADDERPSAAVTVGRGRE